MDLQRIDANTYQITLQKVTPQDLLDFYNKLSANLSQIQQDAGVTTTPTPTPTPTSHVFKGIFNFGTNGSSLATNPYLAGTYLGYAWSQLEPSQGQYNWTLLENDMKPWTDNGKDIILRVSPSGWTKWKTPPLASWTPVWVYAMRVQSVTEDDKAVKPQYWNTAFLNCLTSFVQALAAKYDGDPRIVCIEMGIGDGGETKPDTRNNPNRLQMWQKIGYTDQVWWETIQKIGAIYQAAFKKTPLVLMPNSAFIAGTKGFSESQIINWAISQKPPFWLQENGIIAGKKPDPAWLKTTIVAEQRLKTAQSGDTLDQDLALIMNYGASYALCFEEDLANKNNQPTLQKYAALVK